MLSYIGNIALILMLCLSIRDTVQNMRKQEMVQKRALNKGNSQNVNSLRAMQGSNGNDDPRFRNSNDDLDEKGAEETSLFDGYTSLCNEELDYQAQGFETPP